MLREFVSCNLLLSVNKIKRPALMILDKSNNTAKFGSMTRCCNVCEPIQVIGKVERADNNVTPTGALFDREGAIPAYFEAALENNVLSPECVTQRVLVLRAIKKLRKDCSRDLLMLSHLTLCGVLPNCFVDIFEERHIRDYRFRASSRSNHLNEIYFLENGYYSF